MSERLQARTENVNGGEYKCIKLKKSPERRRSTCCSSKLRKKPETKNYGFPPNAFIKKELTGSIS
jgi:hypothetical protein